MERRRSGHSGGVGAAGSRVGADGSGTSGAWLIAAVAAGCAVAVLVSGPSWALRRPEPRPAVDLSAMAAPSRSDLEVVRLDPDAAPPGGTTTVHAFVANRGPETTASPFTVVVTLPRGVAPEGPYFPADCEVLRGGHRVRCVFGPGLKEGRSATALVPVRLSPGLPLGALTGGSVAVRSADDPDESNNRQPFDIKVVETAAG
ncbi:hypothetical protein [Kitasatospora aureofaciens]|uniref:hypothetical protein n=1 Tax=Kitasatospora aureofaciens TaxID=1894 RepID=UPI001C462626|nr:hypothetical protein [Kitasatospora aureofaciens]MBV6697840.1 hypothetical protein [Kitasatospora aureofaciens]